MKGKKGRKVIRIVVTCVIVLGVVGVGGYLLKDKIFGSQAAASSTSYTVDSLTTGDIEKSITGTGTLSAGSDSTQTAPVDVTIESVEVAAGDTVKKGDTIATVDTDALTDTISTLRSDISTLDSTIAQAAGQQEDEVKVTSSVAGRVKKIYADEGDDAADLTLSKGGLVLLSTDGLMKFTCTLTTANSVAAGDEVTVTTGGDDYDGLVASVASDGKSCVITLTDNGPALSAKAVAYDEDGDKLGSGKLAVNQPYTVASTTGGVVDTIYVDLNDRVSTSTRIIKLVAVPVSDTYTSNIASRKEKLKLLNEAIALQKSGKITATEDGIVSTVTASEGQAVTKGSGILSLYTGSADTLQVSVDELDISTVEVGQSATIAVDAIDGTTYDATVETISKVGTNSNGVTTYPVTLKLASTDNLEIGMNATATIVIEKREGVLLLPIEALNSSRGEQYVWLYTGTLPEDSSTDPGTRTVVETGLSNDNYVEVTSGLTADDQVVVVRTKSTSGSTSTEQSGFGGFGGMTGGMTGGGNFSGGERPSGGMPGGGGN